MKVEYKPLLTTDVEAGTPSGRSIIVGRSSVYDTPCLPVCRVVNYDALPGTCCGKGCCGFVGYLPMVASGLITAGLGLVATALTYTAMPPDERNENFIVAAGSVASVFAGAIASAISCYRSSVCSCGPETIKVKLEKEDVIKLVKKENAWRT
ncbi:MAG: hypothetical protein ACRC9R_00600 [Enterovibrio sp.]